MLAKNITVDGVEYVRADSSGKVKRITIVDNRGLTFVGECDLEGEGDWMTIYDARCVIQWGTMHHIAELVEGPATKTRFGARSTVVVRRANVIASYVCGGGWDE